MTALAPNFELVDNGDGTWTIPDVPILHDVERGGVHFDGRWMDEALAQAERDWNERRHLPPLHINHTKPPGEGWKMLPDPIPVGAVRLKRKGMLRFNGEQVPALEADLIIANRAGLDAVRSKRALWRSVEVPRSGKPSLSSLALLEYEEPFVKLPLLTVRETVANATKQGAGATALSRTGEPVLAFAQRDESLFVLMEHAPMTAQNPQTAGTSENTPSAQGANADGKIRMAEGAEGGDAGKGGDGKGGSGGGGGAEASKVPGLLEKIRNSKLTAAEWAELQKGLSGLLSEMDGGGATVTEQPLGMQADAEKIRMAARIDALAAKDAARDRKDAIAAAVKKGLAEVADRKAALGADAEERLMRFCEKNGPEAAQVLVDEWKRTVAPDRLQGDPARGAPAGGTSSALPAEVLRFQQESPEAFEHAMAEHKRWQAQTEERRQRIPLARWLEIHGAGETRFAGAKR